MTKLQVAWMAGFWEGDGGCGYYSVSRKRSNGQRINSRRLVAIIAQIDKTPLARIVKLTGLGSISHYKNPGFTNSKKYIYHWMVSCRSARIFLKRILPYVTGKLKRAQIIKALKKDKYDR